MGCILSVLFLDQVHKMGQRVYRCETMARSCHVHDCNQYIGFFQSSGLIDFRKLGTGRGPSALSFEVIAEIM